MKIEDYRKGTSVETTCTKILNNNTGEPYYRDFGICRDHAHIWGRKPEDVIDVRLTIIDEDVIVGDLCLIDSEYDVNSTDYFGLIRFQDDGTLDISLIYGNIKLYFMCFAYNPDTLRFWDEEIRNPMTHEIEHRPGDRRAMTVRLKIEEINNN